MRNIVVIISLVLGTASLSAQEINDDPVLKKEIQRLDMAHARAIFQSDAAALDSLMNDDVTVNHPTNRIVKKKKS